MSCLQLKFPTYMAKAVLNSNPRLFFILELVSITTFRELGLLVEQHRYGETLTERSSSTFDRGSKTDIVVLRINYYKK